MLPGELEALPSGQLEALPALDFDAIVQPQTVEGQTDPDAIPDAAEPRTKLGAVWTLGDHRLMCGDATEAGDVERLLDGATPALMVTDPPYGVNYDPEWRKKLGEWDHAIGKVVNDDQDDWQVAYGLFPGHIAYVWMSSLALPVAAQGLDASGFIPRSLIIWDKGHIVIGRGHYHWRHERCWYSVKKGAQANWTGDRKASTLWEIANPQKSETGHSTQKPVECMERPIRNHKGDVYDPFVGSGTTIIAAEREQRRCYAMEIAPEYCDVAVARWEAFTGRKATRNA